MCVRRVQRNVCVKLPTRLRSAKNVLLRSMYTVQSQLNTPRRSAHRHFQLTTYKRLDIWLLPLCMEGHLKLRLQSL